MKKYRVQGVLEYTLHGRQFKADLDSQVQADDERGVRDYMQKLASLSLHAQHGVRPMDVRWLSVRVWSVGK